MKALLLFAVVAVVVVTVALSLPLAAAQQDDDGPIYVHFVPHSHDDVGWLKTIEEYYEQEVRQIYNSVVECLGQRADRRFIVVEMAYFTLWWNEATETQKAQVYNYIDQGQMEFVLGGWCMSDDAGPTYSGTTNQLAEGHRFLKDTFDYTPRYGWQIDPFGLSSYYPTLFAFLGFNGHIINRIHYEQKDLWKAEQHLEFVWRGSKSLGVETELFTHVLDSHYSFPSGYNFEKDPAITDLNIASKADSLVQELQKRAEWFRTRHLFIPGGDDFRWQDAQVQYENWDKLIDYINERQDEYGVEIHYSTLDDYFQSVHATNVTWPVYENDFFPYADNAESYWTGYFTSRPELKGYVRSRAAVLRTSEIFSLASGFTAAFDGDPTLLLSLRHANAEVQHHDGVTGTMKEHVLDMYNEHLADGTEDALELQMEAFEDLLGLPQLVSLSAEAPAASAMRPNQMIPIVVSNSLGWSRQTYYRMFVDRDDVVVLDSDYEEVLYQINEVADDTQPAGTFELYFKVDLPALGYATYYLTPGDNSGANPITRFTEALQFENDVLRCNIDIEDGNVILNVTNKMDGVEMVLSQEIMYYTSYTGPGQPSGTYIFRPNGDATSVADAVDAYYVTGPLVQQVWVQYDDAHKEVFRVYSGLDNVEAESGVELRFQIGVLDYDREVITRFVTNMSGQTLLYSDNNGVEIHERPPFSGEIQANYYPLVAQAYLSDGASQLTLLSERSHGVGTDQVGNVEIMLHRRCSMDDWRGMGEPLDDEYIVNPTLLLLFGGPEFSEHIRPRVSLQHQYRPSALFGPVSLQGNWDYRTQYTALRSELPANVHLLAFKATVAAEPRWSEAVYRLHHIYEQSGDAEYSSPVEIDLLSLFDTDYTVSEEMDLSGTVPMAELTRLQFNTGDVTSPWYPDQQKKSSSSLFRRRDQSVIQLNPMQIYTGIATFA